jgi:hypothetical protein
MRRNNMFRKNLIKDYPTKNEKISTYPGKLDGSKRVLTPNAARAKAQSRLQMSDILDRAHSFLNEGLGAELGKQILVNVGSSVAGDAILNRIQKHREKKAMKQQQPLTASVIERGNNFLTENPLIAMAASLVPKEAVIPGGYGPKLIKGMSNLGTKINHKLRGID